MGVYKLMAYQLDDFPDHLQTQMCIKAAETGPWQLEYVPDRFKTQEMCNKAVHVDPCLLNYVPDWFVTREQINRWYDDDYHCNDNEIIEWYDSYKQRKAQKAKIKEELMPIAWHPSRQWDWCVPEDEKKETEKLFLTI